MKHLSDRLVASLFALIFAAFLALTFGGYATGSGIGGSSGVGGGGAELKVYSDVITVNMSTASGAISYTGVGFKPKAVIFFGGLSSSAAGYATMGLVTDSGAADDQVGVYAYSACSADSFRANASRAITFYQACADNYSGLVTSLDADGFTITWTKTGSPTDIVALTYLAIG